MRTPRKIVGSLLLFCISVSPLLAQQTRWKSLMEQVGELYGKGDYAAATPLAEEALRVGESTFGAEDLNVAGSLNILALLYKKQGRYAEAEPLYKRSVAIREKLLGPDHPAVGITLDNLAGMYESEGRYAEAEPLRKRALAILEKALGPEDPEVATSLNNLADLYWMEGRYGEAESLYKRALPILEKALGPDNPEFGIALDNVAALYSEQGRYPEAEELRKRALAIFEKSLGPEHPEVAVILNNLGWLYQMQGRYDEAEPLNLRALEICKNALGPRHPLVAAALNNLAAMYADEGRIADAEPLYKQALEIEEEVLGPEHPDVAILLNNLATLDAAQGKLADAEPLFKRSLAIQEKALGPDHPGVALGLDNLARLYHAENQPQLAEPAFDRGLATLARQFDYYFTYMSEKERLAFLDTVSYRFPGYFSFCLSYHDQLPDLAGKMYDVVLWEKGFIAQSAAGVRARIQASGDAQALRLLDQLTEKKNQLAKLASAPTQDDAQAQVQRRQQIEQLEKEANDLEKELVKRSSALGEQKRLARVTWQQVRDALKPDEAAVEIVRFPFHDGKKWTDTSYYVALVVRKESQQPAFIVLGEQKNLEGAPLDDYRNLVAQPNPDEPPRAGQGSKFYAAFWQPLEAALGDAKRVYLSPDGALNQVTLGVAPRSDGKLLMEAYDLRTVNSTKDVLRQPSKAAANAAVLVGNPKFDATEAEERAALQSAPPQDVHVAAANTSGGAPGALTRGAAGLRSRDLGGDPLPPLPGTQKEVENVSHLLSGERWHVQTYTQTQALEERVKAVRGPRVLHLATHGFFETDQKQDLKPGQALAGEPRPSGLEDPMLRSGVYLAGADRIRKGERPAADMDDGVLTAYEATQLNLQGTELVVLSACETGLGQSQAGEGVFGLRRGLQEAGAEAVLMSMWSVPDQETQELMALFYRKWLSGKDKATALREAQQEMRAKVKARDGRDEPFFWGAFVLVGR